MPVDLNGLRLYDVRELSERLGIQERTLRRYIHEGRLRGRKLARKWYVTQESLEAYFQKPEERLAQSQEE